MFARIMSAVISLGVLATFLGAISYGLNAPQSIAVVVFFSLASLLLFAVSAAVIKSLLGLKVKSLELERQLTLAYANNNKERQRIIRKKIREQNRKNFWRGILRLIVIALGIYLFVTVLPILFGTTIGEIKDFFLLNPTGSFMMIRIFSVFPMIFMLPVIYLVGFYGPFIIKISFFDSAFYEPGSEEFDVTEDDIIGHEENTKRLIRMVGNIIDAPDLREVGIKKPEQGAIAYGPPGTGKTHSIYMLAGRFGLGLVDIKSSISKQSFIGVAVIAMFIVLWRAKRFAKKHNGTLVIIDEIDGLGQKRSGTTNSFVSRMVEFFTSFMVAPGGGGDDSALIVLMTTLSGITTSTPMWYRILRGRVNMIMDGIFIDEFILIPVWNFVTNNHVSKFFVGYATKLIFGKRKTIPEINEPWRFPPWKQNSYVPMFFFGTTNRPQVLDDALTRAGRLSEMLPYDLPNQAVRMRLITYGLAKIPHDTELDMEENLASLALIFEGKSHVDILEILKRAWTDRRADMIEESSGKMIASSEVAVSMTDIQRAWADIEFGLARSVEGTSIQDLRDTSIHESGHLVVARGLTKVISDDVHRRDEKELMVSHFSAKPRGGSLGRVHSLSIVPTEHRWQTDFETRIAVSLGSYVAELIFFGETSAGTKGDLAGATLLAMQMTSFFGWSPRECNAEDRDKYLAAGMSILVSNEEASRLIARSQHLEYSVIVREVFGNQYWLNKNFADEFVDQALAHDSQREQIAVILGQALVRTYRFVLANRVAVETSAKRLEEEGWEMEGKKVAELLSTFQFEKIWHDDEWPVIELKDPFYAGDRRSRHE